MQISKNTVVTMNIRIKDEEGNVIEDTFAKNQPLSYLHGAGQMMPGIEDGLENKTTGHEFAFSIAPEKAFGPRHDQNVQQVPKEMFGQVENLQVGMILKSVEQGREVLFQVVNIADDVVTIDANHPLAGKAVNVEGAVIEVREPTEEEKPKQ